MCGVFGIYLTQRPEAAKYTYLGLYALQHRGQESCGIVTSDGNQIHSHKDMGLVAEVFPPDSLVRLTGRIGVGHVRYSTTGESSVLNAQPLLVRSRYGPIALAHNGNLVNSDSLGYQLQADGAVFQSTTDTEVILNLIARAQAPDLNEAVIAACRRLQGSFALTIMTKDTLIGIRDPLGIRPLCLGQLPDGYVLASESCALASVGAKYVRDILPGEMVVISSSGFTSYYYGRPSQERLCIFEYIYFARPDTSLSGRNVYQVRTEIGAQLAREYPIQADVVVPAPDSGVAAALGFSKESGIPFDLGLIKNRYVGRTFIQPSQELRDLGVKIKLNPVDTVLAGKRVILIDDSIVRGTTSAKTVALLKEAGAKEVHLFVASPPYIKPCFYGIDTSSEEELIAAQNPLAKVQERIGADSLCYLSRAGLEAAVGKGAADMCQACFTGEYPVPVQSEQSHTESRCS